MGIIRGIHQAPFVDEINDVWQITVMHVTNRGQIRQKSTNAKYVSNLCEGNVQNQNITHCNSFNV